MIKRKLIFIFVGIFIILISGAIALTTLTDNLRIEKVGDTIESWEKTNTYTKEDVLKLKEEYKTYLDKLSYEWNWDECYNDCMKGLETECEIMKEYDMSFEDCQKGFQEMCTSLCDIESEANPVSVELMREDLDKRLDEVNLLLKEFK